MSVQSLFLAGWSYTLLIEPVAYWWVLALALWGGCWWWHCPQCFLKPNRVVFAPKPDQTLTVCQKWRMRMHCFFIRPLLGVWRVDGCCSWTKKEKTDDVKSSGNPNKCNDMEKRGFTNQKARFDSWIRLHVEVSFDTASMFFFMQVHPLFTTYHSYLYS